MLWPYIASGRLPRTHYPCLHCSLSGRSALPTPFPSVYAYKRHAHLMKSSPKSCINPYFSEAFTWSNVLMRSVVTIVPPQWEKPSPQMAWALHSWVQYLKTKSGNTQKSMCKKSLVLCSGSVSWHLGEDFHIAVIHLNLTSQTPPFKSVKLYRTWLCRHCCQRISLTQLNCMNIKL